MKFNKKVLVAMLAATCAIAGTVGLAACKDEKPTAPKVTIGDNGHLFVDGVDTGYEVKGEDVTVDYVLQIGNDVYVYYSNGTSQKIPYVNTNLSVGTNEINLANDALAKGITYKFAPNKAGKYVVIVSGDKAKVTIDDKTVDGSCVIELAGDNSDKEIKCATVDGKAGKFSVTVEPVKALSTTEATDITLPATGKTAYYSVSLAEAGVYTFDVGFSTTGIDALAKYTFNVNGKDYSIGDGRTTSFNVSLNKGDNLISLTSALLTDSTASLSLTAIPTGGTLTTGNNSLTIAEGDKFYAYTFTADTDGNYQFITPHTSDNPSVICVTDIDGVVLLSDSQWKGVYDNDENPTKLISESFPVKANVSLTFFVKVEGAVEADSYSLQVEKVIPPTVNVGDKEDNESYSELTVSEKGTEINLHVETAGTYILYIEFGRAAYGYGQTVSLNGHVFSSNDTTTPSMEIELTAGDNYVTLTYDTASEYEPTITVYAVLTAKA